MSSTDTSTGHPITRALAVPDFRLLLAGGTTSLLGDQFALVATPWLTLQITGDPLALGTVLALEGIPRALFMLVGGAITDRFSARTVMLASDAVRLVLTALMALAVSTGHATLWMLYAFGLGFGVVAGFAVPAENSIVPRLLPPEWLQAGNSLVMGLGQLVGFVGPTLAGLAIGARARGSSGVALAYAIDAATFAASAAALLAMRGRLGPAAGAPIRESVTAAIGTGVRHLWSDPALRVMFLVLSAINFLLLGPLLVGIPVLAHTRLREGAVAFGLLMSAFSGGNLAGFVLAGSLPRPGGRAMRAILVALLAAFGAVVAALPYVPSTWVDFGLLFVLGLGNGYVALILFTWMQTRTPADMLGRVTSLVMFSNTGLLPVSQALSGAAMKGRLELPFVLAGGLVLCVVAWAAFQPGMTLFAESLGESTRA